MKAGDANQSQSAPLDVEQQQAGLRRALGWLTMITLLSGAFLLAALIPDDMAQREAEDLMRLSLDSLEKFQIESAVQYWKDVYDEEAEKNVHKDSRQILEQLKEVGGLLQTEFKAQKLLESLIEKGGDAKLHEWLRLLEKDDQLLYVFLPKDGADPISLTSLLGKLYCDELERLKENCTEVVAFEVEFVLNSGSRLQHRTLKVEIESEDKDETTHKVKPSPVQAKAHPIESRAVWELLSENGQAPWLQQRRATGLLRLRDQFAGKKLSELEAAMKKGTFSRNIKTPGLDMELPIRALLAIGPVITIWWLTWVLAYAKYLERIGVTVFASGLTLLLSYLPCLVSPVLQIVILIMFSKGDSLGWILLTAFVICLVNLIIAFNLPWPLWSLVAVPGSSRGAKELFFAAERRPSLGLCYWVELLEDGATEAHRACPGRIISERAKIRLYFVSNSDGRILLLKRSEHDSSALFPAPDQIYTDGRLLAGKKKILPGPDDWYQGDQIERIYVVFAPDEESLMKTVPLHGSVPDIEFATGAGLHQVASYIKGAEGLVAEESRVGEDIGTYIVRPDGAPIVMEIEIRHQ